MQIVGLQTLWGSMHWVNSWNAGGTLMLLFLLAAAPNHHLSECALAFTGCHTSFFQLPPCSCPPQTCTPATCWCCRTGGWASSISASWGASGRWQMGHGLELCALGTRQGLESLTAACRGRACVCNSVLSSCPSCPNVAARSRGGRSRRCCWQPALVSRRCGGTVGGWGCAYEATSSLHCSAHSHPALHARGASA